MAQHGIVHGDLSAYNILAAGDRLVDHRPAADRRPGRQPERDGLPAARLRQRLRAGSAAAAWRSTSTTCSGSWWRTPSDATRSSWSGHYLGRVRHTRGRVVEVDSLDDLDRRLAAGATSLAGWRLNSLDLTRRTPRSWPACDVAGATFLGLHVRRPGVDADLEARGALVLPTLRSVSLNTYRTSLYAPEDLYDTPTYLKSHDAHAYAWSRHATDRDAMLARTLHDHAIDDALAEWISGRQLVGVMGGHALRRDEPAYAEAARFGHARGRPADRRHRRWAGRDGGGQPRRLPLRAAPEVAGRRPPPAGEGAGVPPLDRRTGWRPPAPYARSTRTERTRSASRPGTTATSRPTCSRRRSRSTSATPCARRCCVQICDAGIVFLPGRGGTVQEVFQDACENYYADESSVAPMVLVGAAYWTETLPVWPLLQVLAAGSSDGEARAPGRQRRRGSRGNRRVSPAGTSMSVMPGGNGAEPARDARTCASVAAGDARGLATGCGAAVAVLVVP